RLLGRDFAQVSIRDGKTGADFFNDLATDKRFLPYLDEAAPLWGRGKIKTKEEHYVQQAAEQVFMFEADGEQLPFHRRHRLGVTSQNLRLRLVDRASGEDRWNHSLPRSTANLGYLNMNQFNAGGRSARLTYWVQGHLAVFTLGSTVYGIDLSNEPKVL